MYKVLIADDESIIRTALAEAFCWEDYDMKVVGLGKNGLEALEMVKTHRPDICLLDIKMPLLNGLELIEKINEIDSEVVKIIISGHDEFEFARKALQLGVYNYILKPIDEADFAVMLMKIKNELDARHATRVSRLRKDTLLHANREVMWDEFLLGWIRGEKTPAAVEEALSDFQIAMDEPTGLVWVNVGYPVGLLGDEQLKEEQLDKCRARLEAHFADDPTFHFVRLFPDKFLLLLSGKDSMRWNSIKVELKPVICDGNDWNVLMHKMLVTDPANNLPDAFLALNAESNKELRYLPMVKKVKKHVDENYHDMQLRLSTFAEKNNMSVSYLSKLFKNETGMSFVDYLIKQRISRSIELLCNTNMKICEISEKVGYSSQHYYCEAFKKVMGMAPTEYRRRRQ